MNICYRHMSSWTSTYWEWWFWYSQSVLDLAPFPCEIKMFFQIHLNICLNLSKNSQLSPVCWTLGSTEYCNNKSCINLASLTTFWMRSITKQAVSCVMVMSLMKICWNHCIYKIIQFRSLWILVGPKALSQLRLLEKMKAIQPEAFWKESLTSFTSLAV